jgi:hypothetical protein
MKCLMLQRFLVLCLLCTLSIRLSDGFRVPSNLRNDERMSQIGLRRRAFRSVGYSTLPSKDDDLCDGKPNDEDDAGRRNGLLVLATVPFAWGTFEPAVRFVYSNDSLLPIPGFVFSTCYYLVAAVTLLSAAGLTQGGGNKPNSDKPSLSIEATSSPWPLLGGLELGCYLFVGNALQLLGLKTIEADRAAFLLQLSTLFVPLLQRNVSTRTWGACVVALMGVAVMGLEGKEGMIVEAIRCLFMIIIYRLVRLR